MRVKALHLPSCPWLTPWGQIQVKVAGGLSGWLVSCSVGKLESFLPALGEKIVTQDGMEKARGGRKGSGLKQVCMDALFTVVGPASDHSKSNHIL